MDSSGLEEAGVEEGLLASFGGLPDVVEETEGHL